MKIEKKLKFQTCSGLFVRNYPYILLRKPKTRVGLPGRGRLNESHDDGECKISDQEFLMCARGTMTTTWFTDDLQKKKMIELFISLIRDGRMHRAYGTPTLSIL